MVKILIRTSLLLTTLLILYQADAQTVLDPIINAEQFKIHQIGPEDGISSPYIISAFQDQFGYIWMGTEYGVDLYNGYEFEVKRLIDSDSTSYKLNWTYNLVDDDDGGVWICSGYGLFYYDRYRDEIITQYSHLDYPPLDYRCVVYGIWKDSQGVYWVFTRAGLFHLDRKEGVLSPTEVPFSLNWATGRVEDFQLLETDDNSVWIPADPNGLYRYNPGNAAFIHYKHNPGDPESLSSDKVRDIIQDREGKLWITTWGGGLNILDGTSDTCFEHIRPRQDPAEGIFSDSLNTLIQDNSGNIWIAGQNGFSKINTDNGTFLSYLINKIGFDYSYDQKDNSIMQIMEDKNNHIWLRPHGTRGILYFNLETEELFQFIDVKNETNGLKGQNRVMSSFIDSDGLVWVVTQEAINIIEKDPQKPFYQFQHEMYAPTSLSYSRTWSILLDSHGDLWVGNEGPVLNRCKGFRTNNPTSFTHFQLEDELYYDKIITAVIEADDENLWVGTWNGLFTFNRATGRFNQAGKKPSVRGILNQIQVDDLYQASNGWLWIAFKDGGLYVYDPGSDRLVNYTFNIMDPDGLSPGIFAICEDDAGNFWFGHAGFGITNLPRSEVDKVFISDSLKFTRYSHNFGGHQDLSSDMVMDVHQDQSGRLWFSTTGGLNLFNPQNNSFQSFYETDGLSSDCVNSILEDDKGNLWISSIDGINKLELNEGYGPGVIRSIHTYGRHHGIDKPVFNEKCGFKSEDGWMFFGGIYGVTYFHPDSVKENRIIAPVHITKIIVNNTDLSDLKKPGASKSLIGTFPVKLPYRQNFLSIEYVALNYLVPDRNQYRYMMVGLDEEWVEAGTRRFAEYPDLKPGEYVFRVIACNEDGLWNEEGASVSIIIHPPWYASIPAYFIYVILLAGAIYLFVRWRTLRLQKEKINLESLVRERTHTVEQQKEELQITLENLKETQTQLIQSEKLAALGGLVAGVAHEINTPVGISVTAASSLAEETQQMADKYKANKISRAEFKDYLNTANQSAKLILSNMEKAATMVQSFKQVSVDQSTEQKRKFKLKEYTEDVIRSLYPKLKNKNLDIEIKIEDDIELDSYPGAFSQVFTNLLMNSLNHGLDDSISGIINIYAFKDNGELTLTISDNGRGIPEEHLGRIFEPFYTTDNKLGTGLGLHIVYNLVTQKLKGTISCESDYGKGTTFNITIPA